MDNSVPVSSPVDPRDTAFRVLDGLVEAVYVLECDGRIVFANAAFARHLGRPRPELLSLTLWEVLPPEQHALVKTHFDRVMRTGEAETFVQESVIQPGKTLDLRVFKVFDRDRRGVPRYQPARCGRARPGHQRKPSAPRARRRRHGRLALALG